MLPTPNSFSPAALVGTTIDGRYRLVEHLASGGMGAVFRAEHVYMRKPLAVKLLRPELSALPDLAERFRREAQIAASLDDEHIVRVTDFGRSAEGWLFLAMDLLQGESLFDRLRIRSTLEPREAATILAQICAGLEAAHRRGVVHRDLKPENVFLNRDGSVKILDFGIAKLEDATAVAQTSSGIVVGTPEYLSPEQAAGVMVDARADLYAVGLMGWRMLAGRHPLAAARDARGLLMMQATQPIPPLADARPDLGATWSGLLAAIDRACSKAPAARHESAFELRADLERCLAGAGPGALARVVGPLDASTGPSVRAPGADLAVRTSPTIALPRAGHSSWRRRRAVILVCVAALVGASGASAAARWYRERPLTQARNLLARNQPEAARALLAAALRNHPSDARLHVLHGRALHRIQGKEASALEEFAAALQLDPDALDDELLSEVSNDLKDRTLADRSVVVLARAGPRAVPAVLAATRTGPGAVRLRAIDLSHRLTGGEGIDLVAEYEKLLADPDCAVRRAAVQRLSELGSTEALPGLRELARQTREVRGLFGFPQRVPICGASEADVAVRKIARERQRGG